MTSGIVNSTLISATSTACSICVLVIDEPFMKLLWHTGHVVSEQDTYLEVDNFFEWLFGNIIMYHSS